jgi:hypothetical protein
LTPAERSTGPTTAPDDQFRQQLVGRGVPAEAADQLLGIFAAGRAGEFAAVDSTLATLLGREPIALSTVLREQQRRALTGYALQMRNNRLGGRRLADAATATRGGPRRWRPPVVGHLP